MVVQELVANLSFLLNIKITIRDKLPPSFSIFLPPILSLLPGKMVFAPLFTGQTESERERQRDRDSGRERKREKEKERKRKVRRERCCLVLESIDILV